MFSSLASPSFRRYFAGQAVSLTGTWMQATAQDWLVLSLSHSGTDLGIVVALQTLPVLLLTPYGGVVADRADKRRLMVVLQSVMGFQALVLGVLTLSGEVRLWQIASLAVILGVNNAFEYPARQSFMVEMVGAADLPNAVTLYSVLLNMARAAGPAAAGILIASAGPGACFLLNAASFVGVVFSLITMDPGRLKPGTPQPRRRNQLREGLSYVARAPDLRVPLAMMAVIGTLAYEFPVSLPTLTTQTFHSGAETYGFMSAAMAVGAVAGGLVTAGLGRTGVRFAVLAATGFGVAMMLAALAPNLALEFGAIAMAGWASVTFSSTVNSTLQLNSAPSMRGRVMALWSVAFQGTTPIGGPLIGLLIDHTNPRMGLVAGAGACLVAALGGTVAVALRRPAGASAPRNLDHSLSRPSPQASEKGTPR
jgi:MFS family permease